VSSHQNLAYRVSQDCLIGRCVLGCCKSWSLVIDELNIIIRIISLLFDLKTFLAVKSYGWRQSVCVAFHLSFQRCGAHTLHLLHVFAHFWSPIYSVSWCWECFHKHKLVGGAQTASAINITCNGWVPAHGGCRRIFSSCSVWSAGWGCGSVGLCSHTVHSINRYYGRTSNICLIV
jgi:hypothetical protein